MVDTPRGDFYNFVSPLCRASLEDLIDTVTVLHSANLHVLITLTAGRSHAVQLGGHLFQLTLEIFDIGIPLTMSAF